MSSTASLALDDRVRIEALLSEYGWKLDHGAEMGCLFAPDAVLLAPGIGLQLKGRTEIARHFASHAHPSRVTCHVWSGLRMEEVSENTVRLTTVQTTYPRLPGEVPAIKHVMVGHTYDVVQRDQSHEWRFVERRLEVLFPFGVALQ
jgi:hypothetical protein